jgi:hypothetical protein
MPIVTASPAPDLEPGRLLLSGGVTPGRAVLGDDPALGLAEPSELPVLLLEPVESFMALDPSGYRRELQTELLVQRGFQRFGPGEHTIQPQPGWCLRRTPTRLALLDEAGETWLHTFVRPGRRWLAAAAEHGAVLVVYGTMVGVRAPRGVPAVQYAVAYRAAELQAARARGLVAAAVLPWQL